MQGTKAASRYAKSLFDLSLEQGALENVYADMKLVQNVCRSNQSFLLLLKSPIIKSDKKETIFKKVFNGRVDNMTMEFICLIARKKREQYLYAIAESFVNKYKEHKKILTAVITTAMGLDADLRAKVLEVVKGATKSEVELVEKVNKDLIGGFIIRVGDKQDDTSIRTKILKLNRVFSENQFIGKF